jgi:growth hormone-inducible transmembrane protein
MAFILRRPFAISGAFRQAPKVPQPTFRAFHQTPLKSKPSNFFASRSTGPVSSFVASRNAFQSVFRRSYSQQQYSVPGTGSGNLTQRLLYGGAIFGGTILAINIIFNRETREDGGMPAFERSYLNDTFLHTGLGVGIIGVAARALHMNGWSYRLMAANPWLVLGLGLAGSFGTMIATRATSPDK